jgi:hypothetical protein
MPRIGKEIAGFGALIVKNASKFTCCFHINNYSTKDFY